MNRLVVAVFLSLFTWACAPAYKSQVTRYTPPSASAAPDYQNMYYWAAHPWKRNLSDSLPEELASELRDSTADVFFIHPTTYTENRRQWNADINDAELNAKTDYSSILYQASAFNRACRVFAPRYRQGHLSAFYTEDSLARASFETAYADVRKAFLHYLQNYHHDRPVVIAGHSQGAFMAERLLKEFFDGKPLQEKLVAAYIIGWPLPQDYFTSIRPCTSPSQTGCAVSWRTYRAGYKPDHVMKEKAPVIVTNPLTWTTDDTYASREMNRGSVLRNYSKVYARTTDAQVQGNVLWVSRPKFPWGFLFMTRNYHIGDINLYYLNIRENVSERVKSFGKK